MTTIYFFLGIIYLIISIALCAKFNMIANEKGYYGMSYFWLCFFLGLPGMILVAALPDGKRSNDSSPKDSTVPPTATWTCKNCSQVNPMTKITCSGCGKYR